MGTISPQLIECSPIVQEWSLCNSSDLGVTALPFLAHCVVSQRFCAFTVATRAVKLGCLEFHRHDTLLDCAEQMREDVKLLKSFARALS